MSQKRLDATRIVNELEQSKFFVRQEKADKDLGKDLHKDLDVDIIVRTSKDVNLGVITPPTQDEVEEMLFRFRKHTKIRVNGDLPEEWKKDLDMLAHQSGVGKYHLVMYAVGKMLGKI